MEKAEVSVGDEIIFEDEYEDSSERNSTEGRVLAIKKDLTGRTIITLRTEF